LLLATDCLQRRIVSDKIYLCFVYFDLEIHSLIFEMSLSFIKFAIFHFLFMFIVLLYYYGNNCHLWLLKLVGLSAFKPKFVAYVKWRGK
jgi:hypothetical protein